MAVKLPHKTWCRTQIEEYVELNVDRSCDCGKDRIESLESNLHLVSRDNDRLEAKNAKLEARIAAAEKAVRRLGTSLPLCTAWPGQPIQVSERALLKIRARFSELEDALRGEGEP